MNSEAIKEVLDTLFSNLEKLETQTQALTQFMKEKKKVTDAQLAPYLEKAGNASNVRWRAARVRIEYLLSSAEREESREKEKMSEKNVNNKKKTSTPSGMEQTASSEHEDAAEARKSVDQKKPRTQEQHGESRDGVPADSRNAEIASETNAPMESHPTATDLAKEANADSARQRSEGQDQGKASGDQEAA